MAGWIGPNSGRGVIDPIIEEALCVLLKDASASKVAFCISEVAQLCCPRVKPGDEGILLLKQTCGKLPWILRV